MKHTRTASISIDDVEKIWARFTSLKISMAEFGRREGIPYRRLNQYRARLLKAGRLDSTHTTVSRQTNENPSTTKLPAFVPLVSRPIQDESERSRLILRCGVFSVSLEEGLNQSLLDQLLEVLKHHA